MDRTNSGPGPERARGESESALTSFAASGVDAGLIRGALDAALAQGASYADVYFERRTSQSVIVDDGTVTVAGARGDLGVGVRAVRGEATGYAYAEDFTPGSLRRAAAAAARMAAGAPGGAGVVRAATPWQRARRWWETAARPVHLDDDVAGELLPLARAACDRAVAADRRIGRVTARVDARRNAVLIADSHGRIGHDLRRSQALRLWCVAEHNGLRERNYGALSASGPAPRWAPGEVARMVDETVRRTLILFDAAAPPCGDMPVVLAAGSNGLLFHEAVGHGLEADFNRTRISAYANRLGTRVARPCVTLVDDPALAIHGAAPAVDDELNATGRTVLVEGGILVGYLHDAASASHYGAIPTGHGRRESFRFPPLPRMRATCMLGGPHEAQEIVRSVKRGLYAETFTDGEVYVGAGDFAFGVRNGWLIEDGVLTRPLKDIKLTGNGPRVLEDVDMVASDFAIYAGASSCVKAGQTVPVSLGAPTVRLPCATVTRVAA